MSKDREPLNARLVLKATPPRGRKTLLARPRLSLASEQLAEKSVISVCASPGFGKTALLTQWRREAIALGTTVAWLNIDQWDDSQRLVEGLMQAMQVATSTTGPHHAPDPDKAYDPIERLSQWLLWVAEFAGEVLLILDDVHLLAQEPGELLAYLLHHVPANLRTVLASRKPLPFPVYDLIAKGQFASVDTEALRLQLAETRALLLARFADRIDADTCARLHQLTEGWALGLQLAIASIDQQASVREAVSTMLVHSGDSHRFFVESLLQRLDPSDAKFLVAVSFLDALHPDLCRAITGREDSPAILERLCELTPILTDAVDGSWLRVHALAREFLGELFEALPEDDRRRYYGAAAGWLASHGFHEEAARRALSSGQDQLALDLAERSLYEIYLTGQVSRIAQWLDRLPIDELGQRPRLRIALGWALAKNDRNADAARIVAPILDDLTADTSDRFESIQIVTTAALYMDRLDEALTLFTPWRAQVSGFNSIQKQVTANLDALLALHQGGPEQARYVLSQITDHYSKDSGYTAGGRDWLLGTSFLWQGQVRHAEESLRPALAEVEPVAGRRSPIACMLAASLAAVLWECDRTDEIENLLADRRDVLDQYALPDAICMAYIVLAREALRKGSMSTAYDLLERLFAIGKSRHIPRLCITALAEQMRLSALQGREQSCESLVARLRQVSEEGEGQGWGILQGLIGIQLGLAASYHCAVRSEWQQLRDALARARPFAEQLRRNKDLLQIHLLDSLAAKKLGLDADSMFRECLYLLETLGLKRLLTDTHPELAQWDRSLRSGDGLLERVAASPKQAAAPARPAQVHAEPKQVAPSMLLTPKERDILSLLANNLSNKEIANALDVSVQTVKWHLKNLFVKLNAGSRKHLVDRARILGIIID